MVLPLVVIHIIWIEVTEIIVRSHLASTRLSIVAPRELLNYVASEGGRKNISLIIVIIRQQLV